ncbi:hypothetical protein DAEQUDRAFT_528164 [Daedalea quercina L-15889]|uniref:Uncharacterized protein n=1 Tax=Daedalea quercina L-15889 TaxID=1314783 RepID=A0A165MA17_9APHY|nr:hypothetical protein DAEQUDRAFT_528164 [Daedalea quercina L-15889]
MLYAPSSHASSHSHSQSPPQLPPHTPSPPQTHVPTLPPLQSLPHIPSPPHMSLVHHSASLPQIREPTHSPATPGLIHRHEEGYASLPPSPLDLTFPAGVQQQPSAVTTLPSLASLQTVPPIASGMCGGAGYASYGHPAVYDGSMPYSFDPVTAFSGL